MTVMASRSAQVASQQSRTQSELQHLISEVDQVAIGRRWVFQSGHLYLHKELSIDKVIAALDRDGWERDADDETQDP
ncbi:hypothetical protein PspLS_01925 [Pyricularia sp. CBS 133598]|nr:hypothetical protein PspLS_01925 [Pyricularia sp. CBS 133598]